MRRTVLILIIAAATIVMITLAMPSTSTADDTQRLFAPPTTLSGAAALMQRTAVVVSLLVVWLIGSVILTLMSGREIRYTAVEIRVAPLHCLILGLVALTSFILTAVLFSYLIPYVIGMPLLIALAVFGVLTKIFGMIAVFHAVGTFVAGARTRDQLARRRWLRGDVALVITGLLILGALRLVPVVGVIIWAAASIFGIGAALATKFGRREPWFLTWRAAAA